MDMNTIRVDEYNTLKTAVSSGIYWDVASLLMDDVHAYFCEDLPGCPAVCSRCEALLSAPLQTRNTLIITLLLQHGAYPAEELCAAGYQYNHTSSTPLQRAVQSGSLDDVRRLLLEGAHDVNSHPRFCASGRHNFPSICGDCDTPLMAAVRREDIALMRLLMAHGASVSEEMHGDFDCRPCGSPCLRKTALLVALHTGNKEVTTELVTSGADVNQSLGPVGTVLHYFYDQLAIVQLLVRLGADLDVVDHTGMTALSIILYRYHCSDSGISLPAPALLRTLLPATRDLDTVLQKSLVINDVLVPVIGTDCMTPFLQHGARIRYCVMYLTDLDIWTTFLWRFGKCHSERFIDLLRAADTDFSETRQRIASAGEENHKRLNLTFLAHKLSQPLTLQAWCVINVRRQLRSVSDCTGIWARIDELYDLPVVIKDQLKLVIW